MEASFEPLTGQADRLPGPGGWHRGCQSVPFLLWRLADPGCPLLAAGVLINAPLGGDRLRSSPLRHVRLRAATPDSRDRLDVTRRSRRRNRSRSRLHVWLHGVAGRNWADQPGRAGRAMCRLCQRIAGFSCQTERLSQSLRCCRWNVCRRAHSPRRTWSTFVMYIRVGGVLCWSC